MPLGSLGYRKRKNYWANNYVPDKELIEAGRMPPLWKKLLTVYEGATEDTCKVLAKALHQVQMDEATFRKKFKTEEERKEVTTKI